MKRLNEIADEPPMPENQLKQLRSMICGLCGGHCNPKYIEQYSEEDQLKRDWNNGHWDDSGD